MIADDTIATPTSAACGHVWSRKELSSCRTGKMALRDIFKFRELPETRNVQALSRHLKTCAGRSWKMAITLILGDDYLFRLSRNARSASCRRPLHEIRSKISVSFVRSVLLTNIVFLFISRFYAGIVISFRCFCFLCRICPFRR